MITHIRSVHFVVAAIVLSTVLFLAPNSASAQGKPAVYKDWPHSGAMWLLTTPDGANLP